MFSFFDLVFIVLVVGIIVFIAARYSRDESVKLLHVGWAVIDSGNAILFSAADYGSAKRCLDTIGVPCRLVKTYIDLYDEIE